MSAANELQKLVYQRLIADAGVHAIVGDRIYDQPPDSASYPYISFGASSAFTDDADCIPTRIVTLQIDVWSIYQGGNKEANDAVDAMKAALHDYEADLGSNALALLQVRDMQVFRDADGVTTHGFVSIEAVIEEH